MTRNSFVNRGGENGTMMLVRVKIEVGQGDCSGSCLQCPCPCLATRSWQLAVGSCASEARNSNFLTPAESSTFPFPPSLCSILLFASHLSLEALVALLLSFVLSCSSRVSKAHRVCPSQHVSIGCVFASLKRIPHDTLLWTMPIACLHQNTVPTQYS